MRCSMKEINLWDGNATLIWRTFLTLHDALRFMLLYARVISEQKQSFL